MENKTIYVWATDKFLSGWGHAEGKIHKQVAVCENWEQANKMLDGFGKSMYSFALTLLKIVFQMLLICFKY